MKKNFIIMAAVFCTSLLLFSCKPATPQPVTNSFKQTFPNISDVDWSQENNEWEAEFKSNGRATSVSFTVDGKLIEQEVAIQLAELPPLAQQSLKGQKTKEIVKATKADGTVYYEVEVGKQEIQFDQAGKQIPSTKKD